MTIANEIDALREAVAQACRVLGRLDLTKASTGHVSARIPGTDRFLIRARGVEELGVRYTTDEQVVEADLQGRIVGQRRGISLPYEVFIHSSLYKARSDINAVVHIHPPTVVLFTIVDKPLQPIYGAYDPRGLQFAIDGIPIYNRSILIDSESLGDDLAQALGSSSICLMRGHGITTVGTSVEEASINAITVNELAEMNYRALQIGTPRLISEEDQEAFAAIFRIQSRRDGGGGDPRAGALWRYYVHLTRAET